MQIDEEKSISPEAYKKMLENYKDTIRPMELAPATKRKMFVKERDSVDHLLGFAGLELGSKTLIEVRLSIIFESWSVALSILIDRSIRNHLSS